MRTVLAFSLMSLASVSLSSSTFYNNEASWLSQVSGSSMTGFEGLSASNSYTNYGAGPLTVGPATFSTDQPTLFAIGYAYFGSGYFSGLYSCLSAQAGATSMIMNFGGVTSNSGSATAVGFFYNTFSANGSLVSLSNGDSATTLGVPVGQEGFFGFTTDTPISTLSIGVTSNDIFSISRYEVATAAVPEPATLIAIGFGVTSLLRRKRK